MINFKFVKESGRIMVCIAIENVFYELIIYIITEIKKETDKAFDRLVRFINHVNRVQNRNSKSTLACLANNLLLVTMFMETISFVSTLFCLGEHKHESNFEESEEE